MRSTSRSTAPQRKHEASHPVPRSSTHPREPVAGRDGRPRRHGDRPGKARCRCFDGGRLLRATWRRQDQRFPITPAPREIQHMSNLARGGFAAMFAALALLVGTPRRAGAAPNNANCKPNRATCTANNQCCSGACIAGLCATPTTTTSTSTSTTTSSTTPTSSTTTTTLRFVDNGDGTVTDNETGLQWEQKDGADRVANFADPHDVDNTYTWSSSGTAADGTAFTAFLSRLNACTSADGTTVTAAFAGHCDWRLPTIAELRTIIDTSQNNCGPFGGGPCIDPTFGPTVANLYWSSTTSAGFSGFAWFGDFLDVSVSFHTQAHG